jgi:hypothetical protein
MTIWDDPETAAAFARLLPSYTFAHDALIAFAQHCLEVGYLYGVLEPTAPATATPYLDDDLTGAAGVGMAILQIAALPVTAEGQVRHVDVGENG